MVQYLIHQGCFTVVNVGYDGYIPDFLHNEGAKVAVLRLKNEETPKVAYSFPAFLYTMHNSGLQVFAVIGNFVAA
ncbi:MAG: hypothetical protein R2794_09375 [Chitinophagales bacterium]